MKIGIYTDVHCSYTSSILPIHKDRSKYTTRLNMIIDTFRWFYDLFAAENVDMIVNCGDLFDSHNLRSEEISAMSEALSYSRGIPEFHVLGNHEILDKRRNFYATALLNNYDHITVIDTPTKLDNGISFLPYMEAEETSEVLPLISNDVLFSHIDIQGSKLNQFKVIENGVKLNALKDLFKIVINGHIHTYQDLGNHIYNIGATTSYSFADGNNHEPSVAILDTADNTFRRIHNPYATRFVKFECNTQDQFLSLYKSIEAYRRYQIVVRVDCDYTFKSRVIEILGQFENILVYRIQSTPPVQHSEAVTTHIDNSVSTDSIIDKFEQFLDSEATLKYSKSFYKRILNEYLRGVS